MTTWRCSGARPGRSSASAGSKLRIAAAAEGVLFQVALGLMQRVEGGPHLGMGRPRPRGYCSVSTTGTWNSSASLQQPVGGMRSPGAGDGSSPSACPASRSPRRCCGRHPATQASSHTSRQKKGPGHPGPVLYAKGKQPLGERDHLDQLVCRRAAADDLHIARQGGVAVLVYTTWYTPGARVVNRKRPRLSVVAVRLVPTTVTVTSGSGRLVKESMMLPT